MKYEVCLESNSPFNINKYIPLGQLCLIPLQNSPFSTLYTYYRVSFTFQNSLQSSLLELPLPARRVLLNYFKCLKFLPFQK